MRSRKSPMEHAVLRLWEKIGTPQFAGDAVSTVSKTREPFRIPAGSRNSATHNGAYHLGGAALANHLVASRNHKHSCIPLLISPFRVGLIMHRLGGAGNHPGSLFVVLSATALSRTSSAFSVVHDCGEPCSGSFFVVLSATGFLGFPGLSQSFISSENHYTTFGNFIVPPSLSHGTQI